jgi:hypothetical protein
MARRHSDQACRHRRLIGAALPHRGTGERGMADACRAKQHSPARAARLLLLVRSGRDRRYRRRARIHAKAAAVVRAGLPSLCSVSPGEPQTRGSDERSACDLWGDRRPPPRPRRRACRGCEALTRRRRDIRAYEILGARQQLDARPERLQLRHLLRHRDLRRQGPRAGKDLCCVGSRSHSGEPRVTQLGPSMRLVGRSALALGRCAVRRGVRHPRPTSCWTRAPSNACPPALRTPSGSPRPTLGECRFCFKP